MVADHFPLFRFGHVSNGLQTKKKEKHGEQQQQDTLTRSTRKDKNTSPNKPKNGLDNAPKEQKSSKK